MTKTCPLRLDADAVARTRTGANGEAARAAFDDHLATCSSCTEIVTTAHAAKRAWQETVERDELFVRTRSEQELMRRLPGAPSTSPMSRMGWVLAALTSALAAWLSVRSSTSERSPASVTSSERAERQPMEDEVASGERRVSETIVVARHCAACRGPQGSLAAGQPLATDVLVSVPAKAHLSLGWAVFDGLVDPAEELEIDGPSTVRTVREGDETVLEIVDGAARVTTTRTHGVRSPFVGVRTRPGAAFTIAVHGARTQVSVTKGDVAIDEGDVEQSLRAGDSAVFPSLSGSADSSSATVRPAERASVPIAIATNSNDATDATLDVSSESEAGAPTAAPTSMELWERAKALLARGDNGEARRTLLLLLDGATDPTLRDRASFTVGELDMARGARARATLRLLPLLDAKDPALAEDAALLLENSKPGPGERANVWTRYLANAPPMPYRARALLELVKAHLDAGNVDLARSSARELRDLRLAPLERARLEALDPRLR